jgi:hypothetical protein
MSKSGFNQRSCTSPPTSRRREGPLTVRGLTAGGSGKVSTDAIANTRPKTQIMHDLDFIPALHQGSMITESPALYFCEVTRDGPSELQSHTVSQFELQLPLVLDAIRDISR